MELYPASFARACDAYTESTTTNWDSVQETVLGFIVQNY